MQALVYPAIYVAESLGQHPTPVRGPLVYRRGASPESFNHHEFHCCDATASANAAAFSDPSPVARS